MFCLISFNKFSDVLPSFTCASVIGSVCSEFSVLIPYTILFFMVFSTIFTIFSGLSFSELLFYKQSFLIQSIQY